MMILMSLGYEQMFTFLIDSSYNTFLTAMVQLLKIKVLRRITKKFENDNSGLIVLRYFLCKIKLNFRIIKNNIHMF
jgi:hypothetical protein